MNAPNKLPPLPEPADDELSLNARLVAEALKSPAIEGIEVQGPGGLPWPLSQILGQCEQITTWARAKARRQEMQNDREQSTANAEALRQSQLLPAGAVAGLVGKWRDSSAFETDGYSILHRCASDLEQALQADAREKGEVDKQEKSE